MKHYTLKRKICIISNGTLQMKTLEMSWIDKGLTKVTFTFVLKWL